MFFSLRLSLNDRSLDEASRVCGSFSRNGCPAKLLDVSKVPAVAHHVERPNLSREYYVDGMYNEGLWVNSNQKKINFPTGENWKKESSF